MADPTDDPNPRHIDVLPLQESHDQQANQDRRSDTAATPTPGEVEGARASEFATRGDFTLIRGGGASPVSTSPGVQWVGPTDLAARGGAVVLDRGAELSTHLRDAVLDGVREGRAHLQEHLARRQESLNPDVSSPTSARERVVGRTGVSR
ncbi:hypothetical protein D7252_18135 [Microbacterium sp. CGR2]|nr:hypothetical protein D7252_18135 [Microbacterium sp. CGR2]